MYNDNIYEAVNYYIDASRTLRNMSSSSSMSSAIFCFLLQVFCGILMSIIASLGEKHFSTFSAPTYIRPPSFPTAQPDYPTFLHLPLLPRTIYIIMAVTLSTS